MDSEKTKPTPTDGPPSCDGTCPVFPFILIPRDDNDTGVRSTNPTDISLGVETPKVWFEDIESGQIVTDLIPGENYQIAVEVKNLGSGPTFTLSVEFLAWTGIDQAANTNLYSIVSMKQGLVLMQENSLMVRSDKWTPAFGKGRKPGDIIVRAYDPWADQYTETGRFLYVNRDRHLAHKSYT